MFKAKDNENQNLLPQCMGYFLINSKGSFIYTISQTSYHWIMFHSLIPYKVLLKKLFNTNEKML